MFARLKRRISAMRTVTQLCEGAERHALVEGHQQPGSEHFLLAALDLPDGQARRIFGRLGVDANQIRPAIVRQYAQALENIGIDSATSAAISTDTIHAQPRVLPPAARASGIELLRRLRSMDSGLPKEAGLCGALVVASIANEQHSVAARALRTMQIDFERLKDTAISEIYLRHK